MRKLLVILFCGSILSCHEPKKPLGVLTPPQLSALLIDIYLAEARTESIRINNMVQVKDSTIRYFLPFEQKLLQSHGLSDSVLKITYTYYLAHPKELQKVYDSVVDSLVLREQRANRSPQPKVVPLKPK